MAFTADAVENSRIVESGGELEFVTSAANKLMLRPDELQQALERISPRAMRIKVTVGEAGEAPAGGAARPIARPTEDEATGARAGQSGGAALSRGLRRRNPQRPQSEGVAT